MAITASLTVPSHVLASTHNVVATRLGPVFASKKPTHGRASLRRATLRHTTCFVGSLHGLARTREIGHARRTRGVSVSAADSDDTLETLDAIVNKTPEMSFIEKLTAAFHIFFPKKRDESSARTEAKKRLRMILVADRCAMNPASLTDMKKSIVTAISHFVEVDEASDVDLSVSTHPDMGTIYSVSVPVKRVKSNKGVDLNAEFESDGMTFKFESDDKEDKAKQGEKEKKDIKVTINAVAKEVKEKKEE
mmetsp:Transcript_256/g.435  ORF Transcript_256/g.435 Transcript_256/m.435 type:complete len:249 (+) Transcript_256:212-958(+)|eukprot:CAMPEP_0198212994 /NCGR_PEP_ID=MMETSP1445-20131203/28535_1 /TAXON_ID=36898 /ORGANISM="Pyramimonas sp., Strain CCMP2087" /LENGTH=248 /DNA_ID=CAMNT_0043887583 /DNA_START=206 /DNA_END=952 /DNA_ORIENTATION=+